MTRAPPVWQLATPRPPSSATPPPIGNESCQHDRRNRGQRDKRNQLASLVGRTVERQLNVASTFRQWNTNEGVISARELGRLAVHRRFPSWVVVLGHHQGRARRSSRVQI